MLIVIEGMDAVGKATQSKAIASRFGATRFSFPDYETPMGGIIRKHLNNEWRSVLANEVAQYPTEEGRFVDAMVFQAMQLANRMEHAIEIQRLLDTGDVVVCDRYWQSGVAYGGADGLDIDYLIKLHAFLPQPDLSILLDVPSSLATDVSIARRPERRDRYETQVGLMVEVSTRYRALWRKMAERDGRMRWVDVDATRPLVTVMEEVQGIVGRAMFGKRGDMAVSSR